ncbi:MAG: hypothetical protein MUO19_05915 [Dehalococcoidales bacterium]|nr:hypothetical protein [Dehalococcoidales bacterium]
MSKLVVSLISIAILTFIGSTMYQSFMNSWDNVTTEFTAVASRTENLVRTSLTPVSTYLLPGRQVLEITLKNDGDSVLSDFEEWDIIVQYYDYLNNFTNTWVDYSEGALADNQWQVKGIYLDAGNGTAEMIDTGFLNSDEEIVIQAQLSPMVHISAQNLAIVSTPGGVESWNYFQYKPLYLHNNPTPPAADTNAQANLPMNYDIPTATVLYDYDQDLGGHIGPGRLIEPSAASPLETNLDDYQDWRMQFSTTIYDSLEFDIANGRDTDIIQVANDIYAIAYRGTNDDGWISTVEISSAGAITDSVIDTFEYNPSQGGQPSLVRVSYNIYAIAYSSQGDDGWISTVEISQTGAITKSVVDSLEFDASNGRELDIIHVSGGIYAIAYRGDGDNGFLTTVEISSAGAITDTAIDTLEYDTDNGEEPSLSHVSGDIYAVAYHGPVENGWLATVEISAAGAITDTLVDTLEFDTVLGLSPSLIRAHDGIYAIAYHGPDDDGWLATVGISAAGDITDTVLDTLEYDTDNCLTPSIAKVSTGIFAVAYSGLADDGFLKTVEISPAGLITDSVIDSLNFDTTQGETPCLIPVKGNIYAVAYTDILDDGWLKTINILPSGIFGPDVEINGNVSFHFWSGMEGFAQGQRGVVTAYLRDYDGSNYTLIATETLDAADWQNGQTSWVGTLMVFTGISYTLPAGHYLELKLLVHDDSQGNMIFAYDTVTCNSYVDLP